ncbi:MAG: nicotinate-nucleotide adenylyltransferase [Xanthomonadales bacterium]|nr:nicotinate-nucleotide adenylyltransferase [Xanthomonadales bacterium]
MSDSDPVAIFGGTFDPVHQGHLRAAESARDALGLSEIRLLPAGTPPHRPAPVASAAQRESMLRLALGSRPGLVLDDRELRRPGPSYMVDTLCSLSEKYPGRPLWLLLGEDAARGLEQWHRWEVLLSLCQLVILTRNGAGDGDDRPFPAWWDERRVSDVKSLRRGRAGQLLECPIDSLPISSSRIRDLLSRRGSVRFLLPDPVLEFIERERLYSPA